MSFILFIVDLSKCCKLLIKVRTFHIEKSADLYLIYYLLIMITILGSVSIADLNAFAVKE